MIKRGVVVMLLLGSGLLIGCEALQGEVPCAADEDCSQGGYLCDLEIGLCRPSDEVNRPVDAGSDATIADRSIVDTSAADQARPEASGIDSSASDSSASDSSTPDSSPPDQPAIDLARPDITTVSDVLDSDDRHLPGPGCSEASPYFLEDAGYCFECFLDTHCDDHNPCTTDTCKSNNTCEVLAVAGRICGTVLDAGTCADGGYCGVCDPEGQCRIRCESDGECGGRTCDIDAGLCPAGLVP